MKQYETVEIVVVNIPNDVITESNEFELEGEYEYSKDKNIFAR